MTSRIRRAGTVVAAAILGASTALSGAASGARAQARIDPAATKVAGDCNPGSGRIAMTVLPTDEDTFEVTVSAGRLPEGTRWQTEFAAFRTGSDDEVGRTFRRRAVDGTWTITTEVASSGQGPAVFSIFARPFRERQLADIACLLQVASGPRVVGLGLCGRGFEAMLLRRRENGTLLVRPFLFFVAPDTRWRLQLNVEGAGGGQGVAFDASSNDRGIVRSRIELTSVPQNPVFTMRAVSERGAFCRLRINPRTLSPGGTGQSLSPRDLTGRAARHVDRVS